MRLYRYIGPRQIAERVRPDTAGTPVRSPDDVRVWVRMSAQELVADQVTATFVVDASGTLLVADRRSEHVACASGGPVCSAGEMTFVVGRTVEVAEVSNQSTGYCPEVESWPAVAEALARAGLSAPEGFSPACEFRRCNACENLVLVKDGVFECEGCGKELPAKYNIQ